MKELDILILAGGGSRRSLGDRKMRLTEVLERLSDMVYVSTEELKKADQESESFSNVNLPRDLTNFYDGL